MTSGAGAHGSDRDKGTSLRLSQTNAWITAVILGALMVADPAGAGARSGLSGAPSDGDASQTLARAEAIMHGDGSDRESSVPGKMSTDLAEPEAGAVSEDDGNAGAPSSPTIALADLVAAYPALSERERVRADELLARPDRRERPEEDLKDWSSAATVAEPVCGEHVCV
ncbi:MAG: hypothetical protein ACRCYU_05450, partial [Nocardioides sp.]